MDLVIVYEDKAAKDREGHVYIGTAFSNAALRCYLEHFDHITMLMRRADVSPDDEERLRGMNRIDDKRIQVAFIPNPTGNLRSFLDLRLRREYRRAVVEQITPERAVVIRAPSTSGSIAARYCNRIGKTYLVEAIGCPWDSYWNHSLRGKLLAPFMWASLRRTMRHAPHAVYVTSAFLQRRYPTKGISAGISDVELQPMEDAVLARRLEKIRSHTGRYKIGTGGALVSYKGQQFVIRALAKLKSEGNTNFEYHMAGDGDEPALRALAQELGVTDQVIFEGRLSHEQMFAWLDEMDLYIQPSLQDGLPRALVEAMSRGLPALGARTGGIPELLDADCIFPRKGVDAICELLRQMEPARMERMAKNTFATAHAFQKDELSQRRHAFYAEFARAAVGESNE